jgi:hypothetical protein
MALQQGIFTTIEEADKVAGQISIVSSGMWSGGVGTLNSFYTSSTQSGSTGQYYLDAYQGVVGSDATASIQFSAAYGNFAGSGSKTGDADYAASKAIYRQFRNLLLPQSTNYFLLNGPAGTETTESKEIFAISVNRSRLKEKMDPGNWELQLSGSATDGDRLHLIDDSGATSDPTVKNTTREFNIISGSIVSGAVVKPTTDITYGKFYPETGVIILDVIACGGATFFSGYATPTNSDSNNTQRFYHAISGGAYFASRREESIRSTHYFCRVKHDMYNHSQNPTYFTASDNQLTVPSFRTDPQSYITTVGLYNGSNELLAVAKLSRPVLKSSSREALIKVRLDF